MKPIYEFGIRVPKKDSVCCTPNPDEQFEMYIDVVGDFRDEKTRTFLGEVNGESPGIDELLGKYDISDEMECIFTGNRKGKSLEQISEELKQAGWKHDDKLCQWIDG